MEVESVSDSETGCPLPHSTVTAAPVPSTDVRDFDRHRSGSPRSRALVRPMNRPWPERQSVVAKSNTSSELRQAVELADRGYGLALAASQRLLTDITGVSPIRR